MAVDESAAGDAEWVVTARGDEDIAMKPRTVREALVPNVGGMGLRDAVYLLENSGLKVGVKGAGTVRKQSIGPGTRVRRGSYILIELR